MAGYNNYNRGSSAVCLIIALVFFGAIAEAQVLSLKGLNVSGSLCCTPTGNCPGQGLGGVPVRLNCTNLINGSTTVSTTTTNANGGFSFTVPALAGILSRLPALPCNVSVQLPVSSVACPVLNTANRTLTATTTSLGTFINSALGLLLNAAVNRFVNAIV